MPPVIDYEKCTACGECVEVCSEDVFFDMNDSGKAKSDEPKVTHPEFCYHCYLCVNECPVTAISLRIPMPMMVPYK